MTETVIIQEARSVTKELNSQVSVFVVLDGALL